MDVCYFLEKRLEFIQKHDDTASIPFTDTLSKIERGEHPFQPTFTEGDEPPFFDEWCDARTSLEVLGRSGISMVSESLKLYLKTWATRLGLSPLKTHKKAFDGGFVSG